MNIRRAAVLGILVSCPFAQAGVFKKSSASGIPVYSNVSSKGAVAVAATSYVEPASAPDRVAKPFRPRGVQQVAYAEIAEKAAARYGVDPVLVNAVIQVESNFDPRAVSRKGAQGLMQLMPATADRFDVKDAFEPAQNIEGGVKYLKALHEMFDGDTTLVVASYNAGENAVRRHQGVPDYAETKDYVRKVLALTGGVASSPVSRAVYQWTDDKGVVHLSDEKPKGRPAVRVRS